MIELTPNADGPFFWEIGPESNLGKRIQRRMQCGLEAVRRHLLVSWRGFTEQGGRA